MESIRPISDLRNNFAEISKQVNEYGETVFLTKNGYGNMVVMGIDSYNELKFKNSIISKLKEVEYELRDDETKYTHDEVFAKLREIINERNS